MEEAIIEAAEGREFPVRTAEKFLAVLLCCILMISQIVQNQVNRGYFDSMSGSTSEEWKAPGIVVSNIISMDQILSEEADSVRARWNTAGAEVGQKEERLDLSGMDFAKWNPVVPGNLSREHILPDIVKPNVEVPAVWEWKPVIPDKISRENVPMDEKEADMKGDYLPKDPLTDEFPGQERTVPIQPVQPFENPDTEVPTIPKTDISEEEIQNPGMEEPGKTKPIFSEDKTKEEDLVKPVVPDMTEQNPIEQDPTKQNPVEQVPIEQNPMEQVPIEQNPVEQVSIEQNPIEQIPIEQDPTEQNPGSDLTVPGTEITDSSGADGSAGENGKAVSCFLLDDAGMLYGFLPEYADLESGCLELPEECTGIRCGAFSGCGGGIVEIYIPANAAVIEEGAFFGLDELEWIEVDSNNMEYASLDGVLFSSSMSDLLAFPSGRILFYLFPSEVTYVANNAFANTSINRLDLRTCGWVSFGENVFGEGNGEGIDMIVPAGMLEEYQEMLMGYGGRIRE